MTPDLRNVIQGSLAWIALTAPAFGQPLAATAGNPDAPHPAVSIGHQTAIDAMFASPDGQKLFTDDGGNLRAWDVASQKELSLLSTSGAEWTYLDATRKWMFGTSWEGFSIVNYETLQSAGGSRWENVFHFVWDESRGRGYTATASHICELVQEHGHWRQKPRYKTEDFTVHVTQLVPLEDNRLLVAFKNGYGILNTDTWELLKREENDPREFEPGPPGTLLAITRLGRPDEPRVRIDLVSQKDLSIQGSIELRERYWFNARAYDPHTATLGLIAGQNLLFLDANTMREKTRIPVPDTIPAAGPSALTCIQATGEWFAAAGTKLMHVDPAAGRLTPAFDGGVFRPRRIIAAPNAFELLASDAEQNVKRIRFTAAGVQIGDFAQSVGTMAYAPDGTAIAYSGRSDTRISISEPAKFPQLDYDLFSETDATSAPGAGHVFYSPDGSIIGLRHSGLIRLINVNTGKIVLRTTVGSLYDYEGPGSVAISRDNSLLIAYGASGLMGVAVKTGKTLWTQKTGESPRTALYFLSADTFGCVRSGAVEYRNTDSGSLIMDTPIQVKKSYVNTLVAAVSPDTTRVAVYDGENIQVFDTETGVPLMRQASFASVRDITFLGGSRYVVTAGEDSLLRVLDIDQKRELCSLALFTGNSDWIASAPDFRFEASEKAVGRMYVVHGTTITPLESLFDKLYTPKLVAGLFAGEKLPPPAVDFTKLSPPPNVRLEFSEQARNLAVEDDLPPNTVDRETVQVHAIAQASRAALRELRVFQNGKIVSTAGLSGNSDKKSFELTLVPGENVFRGIAANIEGTESRPSEIVITYRSKTAAPVAGSSTPQPAGLQLHLLVVGVNVYKNPKYNLNYAVADATAVKEKIEAQTRSIFTGVNVKFILNDQALKSSIAAAFEELTTQAGPRDVFVFYYAGHGVMTSDEKPEFFLVPHDVTQLYGADDALRQKGLSSSELMEFAKAMPAQKQLFILDACQSAGALTTVAMRGAAEEKAIAQLARSTGTHWLTASGSEQFATEFATLGHGAFTYALLEGLSGRADSGDGRITVNELKAYLESAVPELTKLHKGTPQYPASYGFGQDFPISINTKTP